MKLRAILGVGLVLLVVILFFFPAQAHAYLDPGTGSYFIQIALAAFVGALFAVRLFWGRIKVFFRKLFSREEEGELEEPDAE